MGQGKFVAIIRKYASFQINHFVIFQAVLGLPADFLRLTPRNVQESVDREAAMALQQQQISGFGNIRLAVRMIHAFFVFVNPLGAKIYLVGKHHWTLINYCFTGQTS